MAQIELKVNGASKKVSVEDRVLLVNVLRDELGLTGTHVGCDTSQCGACTVHLNGRAVKSCTMLGVQAGGADVVTIEGMATNGKLHPVQQAFTECHALQCGYCTPGMVMAVSAFLKDNPDPTDAEIERALEGNLCRCTGYINIVRAVKRGAELMRGGK